MDPITIGLLGIAAGSAAYKMYKDSQGGGGGSAKSSMSAFDRLKSFRDGKDPNALGVASTAVGQTAAAAAAPTAGSMQYQPSPPASTQQGTSALGTTQPNDPLARLRRLQNPGF